ASRRVGRLSIRYAAAPRLARPRSARHALDGIPRRGSARSMTRRGIHARAQTQLRMLRPRSTSELDGCTHLFVRVHILRIVCRARAPRAVPELRRRAGGASSPPGGEAHEVSSCDTPHPERRPLSAGAASLLMSGRSIRPWHRECERTCRRGAASRQKGGAEAVGSPPPRSSLRRAIFATMSVRIMYTYGFLIALPRANTEKFIDHSKKGY